MTSGIKHNSFIRNTKDAAQITMHSVISGESTFASLFMSFLSIATHR
jgi:hypothetical protein